MLMRMPDENPWRRRLRSGIAFWAIVSALSGPLLTGYKFLSRRGGLPGAPENAGPITVLVNACMLTWLLLFVGAISSSVFVGLTMREDRRWKTIGKAIFFALFGWSLTKGSGYSFKIGGWLLLLAVFCLITPISHWIEEHILAVSAGFAIAMIGAMLFMPNWMRDWWTSSGEVYQLTPLSEMHWYQWASALFGAGVYVAAFVAFQQWRTDGKWLDVTKRKLSGEPE
jgi:hypothetical protein